MNYRDYFKKESITGKLKDPPKNLKVNPEELEMGIDDEKEHTDDPKLASIIAQHHLADDPNYYEKMKSAGIDEENETDVPKNEDGSLKVPRMSGVVSLGKIINVGKMNGKSACGDLSGYTSVGGGVPAGNDAVYPVEGDKEHITAGGESDKQMAQKSVGGPITSGEGQKQGGPNHKGKIAGTSKLGEMGHSPLFEDKKKITLDDLIKEVLNEMGVASPNPLRSYNTMPDRMYRVQKDDHAREVQRDPKMTENEVSPFNHNGEMNQLYEKTPPGFPEELMHKLKRQYKGDKAKAYATAWSLHNKGQVEEVMSKFIKHSNKTNVGMGSDICAKCGEEYHNDYSQKNPFNLCADCGNEVSSDEYDRVHRDMTGQDMDEGVASPNPLRSYNVMPDRMCRIQKDDHGREVQRDPKMTEAGGMSKQEKSYRTVKDMPQISKNRHASDINEGWAMGEYTSAQQATIAILMKKGFREVGSFPSQPDSMGGSADGSTGVVVVMQKKKGPVHLSGEVEPDGTVNGENVESFLKSNISEFVDSIKENTKKKV